MNNAGKISVVQPISAPTLEALDRDSIIKFLDLKAEYEQKMNGASMGRRIMPIKSMLSMPILKTLSLYCLGKPITAVDNEEILAELLHRKGETGNVSHRLLDQHFMDLKMNLGIPCPKGRCLTYMEEAERLLEKHGLQSTFDEKIEMKKLLIKYLIKGIRPSVLRDIVDYETKLSVDGRTDKLAFFQCLQENCVQQDKFHERKKFARDYAQEKDRSQSKRKATTTEKSGAQKFSKKKESVQKYGSRPTENKHKGVKCLFCGYYGHKLADCRKASESEKKMAWEKFLKLKKVSMPSPRPLVRVNNCVNIPYCIDTGADRTVISKAICLEARAPIQRMKNPMLVELALGELSKNELTAETVLSILEIETDAGRVTLRNVKAIVSDPNMNEMLIGKDVLYALGIDIDSIVSMLAGETFDLQHKGNKYTSILRKDFTYIPLKPLHERENDSLYSSTSCTSNETIEDTELDPPEILLGFDEEQDLKTAVDDLLNTALSNGLPVIYRERLHNILWEYPDIWRIKLGPDPPARVPPMKVHLKADAKYYRAKPRKYPPLHRAFIKQRGDLLRKFGYTYRNNRARCASAVHVVPKVKQPKNIDSDFRWCVDVRGPNKEIEPILWPMPNLELMQEHIAGKNYFQTYDLFKGYWQMPLHESCQELYSIITDEGVDTPTRVIQGSTDAVMYFQSTLQECFKDKLYESITIWLDDVFTYVTTYEQLLHLTKYVLTTCNHYKLKLNAKKCVLFATDIRFCGKIINSQGIRHDNQRIEILSKIPEPATAAELQQFLCACNWLRASIPNYARASEPLQRLLNDSLAGTKRSKRVAQGIPVSFSNNHRRCLANLKELISNAVVLAHPNPMAEFCLLTDASQLGWGAVLVQVPEYDISLSITVQQCEPLYFLGGTFKGSQLRWSIIEKEAFALITSVIRLEHLLLRPKGFRLFCDHRNLIYLFHHDSKTLSQPTSDKLQRWALRLAAFRYTIEHIPGEDNHWADLLSRWGQQTPNMKLNRLTFQVPIHPFVDFDWPNMAEIIQEQQKFAAIATAIPTLCKRNDTWVTKHDQVWIPEASTELINRLCVIAHCGLSGHRGTDSTLQQLRSYCFWSNMEDVVKTFCKSCLLCLQANGGKIIPRPLGRSLVASKPGEVIHFDFCFLEEAHNALKYVLVLKDGFSQLVRLIPTDIQNADIVVRSLLDWIRDYGCFDVAVSDQGSHFKNQVIAELHQKMKTRHHFVTAYCPFSNGTVERVNRSMLSVLRTMRAEFQVDSDQWPSIITLVNIVLNSTKLRDLGNRSPIQVMSGIRNKPPVAAIFLTQQKEWRTDAMSIDEISTLCKELHLDLLHIHKDVSERKASRHNQNHKHFKAVQTIQFSTGDYVLWSQVDRKQQDGKLYMTWRGPYRVLQCKSTNVYTIEHINNDESRDVHASRLKFFQNKALHITEELTNYVANSTPQMYEVGALMDLKKDKTNKTWKFLVHWYGFEQTENTWEPASRLIKSTPAAIKAYLNQYPLTTNTKQFKKAYRQILRKILDE